MQDTTEVDPLESAVLPNQPEVTVAAVQKHQTCSINLKHTKVKAKT